MYLYYFVKLSKSYCRSDVTPQPPWSRESHNKLVGLFHNLRLMAKMNKTQYVESAVGWNDDELKSGITKFGIVNHS